MEFLMRWKSFPIVLLGCLVGAGPGASAAEAASAFRATSITIKMENENCAKCITTSLREVPNVGEVTADSGKKVVTVSPVGLRAPSARALWEAVEKTGHVVVQLQGPQGKFTSKPEN
jgi:hypothetical protein